jgi:trehalose 6-phosphate synthase
VSGALFVVSNRLPVQRERGGVWRPSAGGLVTAMRPVMAERQDARWVGWSGGRDDVPERVDELDATLVPVKLTRAQVRGYYEGFANRSVWPLFHDLVEQPVFDRGWWETYREVNEIFADAVTATVSTGSRPFLWVHDYHLLLLPGMLRERLPKARIGFFLHIPWPAPELFARLPWRRQLLDGLLGSDVVSFHTDRYRKNFARTCGRLLDDATVRGKNVVVDDGRDVRTQANPISIDAAEFASVATSESVEAEVDHLRKQFAGRRVLLGVDRLDYTKGILQRLEAFELLLERQPGLAEDVTLVQIAVPSRSSVAEYRELRAEVERRIGRINGRFTPPGGDVPVHYLHRGVSRPRLIAYYLLADVMVVTPLKDGMNLVAKEFVVCQEAADGDGALLLSEFTGSCLELREAYMCNPFDVEGVSHQIEHVLETETTDRRKRLRTMGRRVRRNDVHAWAERELEISDQS